MAVLGSGGRLELRREAPSPCVILPEDLNLGSNSLDIGCEGYWPGDKVVISNPEGLPIFIDGKPGRWDGVASYFQNVLYVADNRDHITAADHQFYKSASEEYPAGQAGTDDANLNNTNAKTEPTWFYYRGDKAGDDQITQLEGYLCIDSLGRAKLYSTRCEGLACCGDPLLVLNDGGAKLDFDFIVINQAGTSEYQNAITKCFGEIGEYIFNDIAEDDGTPDPNRRVDSICNDPPLYLKPAAGTDEFDNANVLPRGSVNKGPHPLWVILCEIREWSLELDAPAVDTTGVGEKFGESVKSLVTGGGSADFFIDRKCMDDGKDNGLYLMQLLLMTQMDGCKAKAKFFMISRPYDADDCAPTCGSAPGSLWYETEILVTRNAVNLRPTQLVAGTAQFVTVGEIRLNQGQVLDP